MLILLALLQIADGVLTHLILGKGGREVNPVVRFLIGKLGQVPALIAAKLFSIAIVALLDMPLVTLLATGLTAFVVIHNARVLSRL